MPTTPPWRLEGRTALLQTESLTGSIHLDHPEAGMTAILSRDTSLEDNLWGWSVVDRVQAGAASPPAKCRDAYVRGNDLVLTYAPSDASPFETQVYWRASTVADVAQLSLLVSIRTHLLDTEPLVRVESRRDAVETLVANNESLAFGHTPPTSESIAVLQRGSVDGPVQIEACRPEDQSQLVVEGSTVIWELFSHFLEKGVIRRARLTALFAADANSAADAYRGFLAEPPPLTT